MGNDPQYQGRRDVLTVSKRRLADAQYGPLAHPDNLLLARAYIFLFRANETFRCACG